LEARLIELDDRPEIAKWWTLHKWPVIDFDNLPASGFIVPGVCAAWVYETNSPTVILEWVISNPESDQRDLGLNILLNHIDAVCKAAGYKQIFTATKHPKLLERLKNHSFLEADQGLSHLMKAL